MALCLPSLFLPNPRRHGQGLHLWRSTPKPSRVLSASSRHLPANQDLVWSTNLQPRPPFMKEIHPSSHTAQLIAAGMGDGLVAEELWGRPLRARNKNPPKTKNDRESADSDPPLSITSPCSSSPSELHVVKVAEEYQEHMKKIPIPMILRSDAMFITWHSLANSMKQFYGQPLHYLTHVLVKQWDQSRIGNVDEENPMDNIIHSRKAESTIWGVEEVHRRCTSHIHLAKLWLSDPDYSAVVGDVITSKLVA